MEMILDALASYLGEQFAKMVEDEAGMLLGASGEVEKLTDTLNRLKKFLADAERRHITDAKEGEYVHEWVRKLRDAMYDATDIVDDVHLKAEKRCASPSPGSCSNLPLLWCLQDPLFAHRIGSRVKELNERMDGLFKQADTDRLKSSSTPGNPHSGNPRRTAPGIIHEDIVSDKIEEDKRMLVDWLINRDKKDLVVAIQGVGGIGKTTLAKKIFNDQAIQDTFDVKIWLSVTQDFNEAHLLKTAIAMAMPDEQIPAVEDMALLQDALVKALRGKKLLLVMDDVWAEKAWDNGLDNVLRFSIAEACAPGTRVLVTTRNEDVAQAMKAAHVHRVTKLELPDSWTLLQKQVALSVSEIEIVRECGMKIAEKCDGLPLAIKVIGGVLRKKNATKNTWEEVLRNQIWSKTGLPGELNKAIYLSYEDLNPNLKQCFVYYSLFPKDETIGIDKIVSMWIAEGFIGKDVYSTQSGYSTQSVGLDYYKELIKRNLLEPQDDYYNQEHCIMHDVVRSFAQHVARYEALVFRDPQDNGILSSSKVHRLSISAKQIEWSDLRNQHCLRTLLLFGNIKLKPGDSLRILPSLRTIHDSLCRLKHLRYLELRYTDISALPCNIGRMKFLEHIGVRGCHRLAKLPSSIIKLDNLRHLSIDETKIRAIPRGFSRLLNLDLLWGFPVHSVAEGTAKHYWTLEDVGPLLQLRKLKLKGLENAPSTSAALAKLRTKGRLTSLELLCTSDETKEANFTAQQEQIKEVFDQLCPPKCLEELTIGGYYGDTLPGWIKMPAADIFKDLRRLNLQNLVSCIQLSDGLGQLPNLDFFVVDGAPCIKQIGHCLFFEQGQRNMDTNKSSRHAAFPKLHELHLKGMMEWEEWTWEKHVEAMPVLSVLHVRDCKLSHLPPGLPYQASALKRLCVRNVRNLSSMEGFSSVVKLEVYGNPNLERIVDLPSMQNLTIVNCPKLMLLDCVASVQIMQLGDHGMEMLPEYLRHMKLRHLKIVCSLNLLKLMSTKHDASRSEWEKISHIMHVEGFASDNGDGNLRCVYSIGMCLEVALE
uniref:Uncharacterized protein n=1 Tax=Oryza punctata TaxID=4537 RepID=A0A0E0M7B6_ORYPU